MGVWVWLASELMFFAALFAAYFMIRQTTSDMATAGQQTLWQSESSHLTVGAAASTP
ncbi:cytochrome c oxidase polypeptide III [Cutibacterium acnes JCM 18918]|nr:cytochrome c oxidase polypeptide III [Cutibacterium acnes JCM 18918]